MNYTDKEREIFAYFDGKKEVYIDPLKCYRRLMSITKGKPNQLQNEAFKRLPDLPDPAMREAFPALFDQSESDYAAAVQAGYDASLRLEEMIRELFHMHPFDEATGEGATLTECLEVWHSFRDFLYQKKTPRERKPTSSEPMAGPPATVPVTPSGADSSSTSPASAPAM